MGRDRVSDGLDEPGAVEQMHLVHVRNRQNRKRFPELHARSRFLQGLAKRRLRGRFVELHEPGRKRPESETGLDRAPAQQDPVLPLRDSADYHQRIPVVDGFATVADMTRTRIAWGDAQRDFRAAVRAEVHRLEGKRAYVPVRLTRAGNSSRLRIA